MKYHQVIFTLPRLLSAAESEDYVAGPTILEVLRTVHGLKPAEQRKGLTVYDRQEIDLAIEKMKKSNRKAA